MVADRTRRGAAGLPGPSTSLTQVEGDAAADEATWFQAELLEAARQPIIAVDLDRVVVYWNNAAEEMFGWSGAEAVGRRSTELISRVETPEQTRAIVDALARGESWSGDYEVKRRDGSQVSVHVTNKPVHDRHGDLVAVIGVCTDITERKADELARRRLAAIVDNSGVAIFATDPTGVVTSWNAAAERIFGYAADEAVGRPAAVIMGSEHAAARAGVRARLASGGPPERHDVTCVRNDGSRVVVRVMASTTKDDAGTITGVTVMAHDLTERLETARALEASEHRFEVGFEQSSIGAALVDLAGIPMRVNAALCALMGRPEADLVGRRWTELHHPDEIPLGEMVLTRIAEGHDSYDDERRFLRPDGSVVWGSTHVILVRDEAGDPDYLFAQLEDITARKGMEQELTHMAMHDALTGLPNRALLIDDLTQFLTQAERRDGSCAVLSLNVDRLKAINDTFGFAVGDELLRQMAGRIVEAARPEDMAARCNGDEFVVTCHGVSLLEAEQIAERILVALRQPFVCEGESVRATASVGIAVADERATAENLLRDAAVAVHRAKVRGRGRVELFDEVLRGQAELRSTTSVALREGLERQEFVVHYQPVVDLETGTMVSAEALVRWERPGRGLVGPMSFIPLAEETGLIIPIGTWVLEEACGQLAEWQRTQPAMTVSVNLSVRQLAAPDIVEVVEEVLSRTGVPPESVWLELTESVLMDDVDHFGAMLGGLKALGVRLSIDDFGTGYSSLSYLQRFPVDAVKIDRSFVSGMGTNPHDSALVVAIIAMAEALGLEVTAEGVETHGQLMHLKCLRCPRAQGFHLARPMPAAALTELILDGRRWPVGSSRASVS